MRVSGIFAARTAPARCQPPPKPELTCGRRSTSIRRSHASGSEPCLTLNGTISSTRALRSAISLSSFLRACHSWPISPERFLTYSKPHVSSPPLAPLSLYFRLSLVSVLPMPLGGDLPVRSLPSKQERADLLRGQSPQAPFLQEHAKRSDSPGHGHPEHGQHFGEQYLVVAVHHILEKLLHALVVRAQKLQRLRHRRHRAGCLADLVSAHKV